ncbi:MAG: iron ABC transporter permease [Microbacteriaceae bacterium]|nr:iron ABC transporter permease [Microbacteriaceae bacterium]
MGGHRAAVTPWRLAGGAALVAFLGVFFLWPVAEIVARGIAPDGSLDLAGIGEVLGRSRTLRIVGQTLAQAVIATVACVLLGLPGAFVLYRLRFRGRAAVRALALVPFVLPTVVVGVAFKVLFAGTPLDGSWWAIVLALVFFNVAVVTRTVGIAWEELDPSIEESAADLGSGPWSTFGRVTLPRLGPALVSAAIIVFLFSATAFGVVLVLGGARFGTVETEIWLLTSQYLDLPGAAGLSVVQLVFVVAVLWAAGRARSRTELRTPFAGRAPRRGDWPVAAGSTVVGVLLAVPIAALVGRSFASAGGGWTLDHWAALTGLGRGAGSGGAVLGVTPLEALGNSLAFAAAGAFVAMLVGLGASVLLSRPVASRWGSRLRAGLEGALMLPLGVSAVTLGFGYLVALDAPPLDLRSSPVLVPMAQALVAAPLVIRTLLPVLRGVDPLLRDAAADLGAGPGRVLWSVELRLAVRPIVAAAGLAFAVCLGEFGATAFLSRPDAATLPVVIERLASHPGPGNLAMANAAAVLLALVTVAALGIAELAGAGPDGRLRRREPARPGRSAPAASSPRGGTSIPGAPVAARARAGRAHRSS